MADTDKLKKLIENGVHFGHQIQRRDPRMDPFIWGKKNGVHLIDVSKTVHQLERAAQFLEAVASEGKQILFVGTKRPAQGIIEETAKKLNCPFSATRWVGGTLSNYPQVRKSVTKLLHYEDVVSKSDKSNYTKKEIGVFQKVVGRLQHSVGGVRQLHWPVGALVVVDAKKEATAIKEAVTMRVPVVALVDTNSDPSGISIIIPGNDDSARSIRVIIEELAQAVERGMEKAKEKKVAIEEEAHAHEGSGETGLQELFADGAADEEAEGNARRSSKPRRAPGKSEELREAGKTLDKASSVAQKASAAAADKAEERVAAPAPAPRLPAGGVRRPRTGGAPTGSRTPSSGPRAGGPRPGPSTGGVRRPSSHRPRPEGAERSGNRVTRPAAATEKPAAEAPRAEKANE